MNQSLLRLFLLLSPVNDVEPTFWLGCSLLLVAVSLTAVLMAALPVIQELARAARSAEKFFDTLNRELPPTLAAIRATGSEIGELKKDVDRGVQSAVNIVEQVDRNLVATKQQVGQVRTAARGFWVGTKVAWQTFRSYPQSQRVDRIAASEESPIDLPVNVTEDAAGDRLQPPAE
jgi:hypothetical protein